MSPASLILGLGKRLYSQDGTCPASLDLNFSCLGICEVSDRSPHALSRTVRCPYSVPPSTICYERIGLPLLDYPLPGQSGGVTASSPVRDRQGCRGGESDSSRKRLRPCSLAALQPCSLAALRPCGLAALQPCASDCVSSFKMECHCNKRNYRPQGLFGNFSS